jgi:ferredoxin
MNGRLRKYNIPKQTVEFRRSNYGGAITNNLKTVSVDPVTLDMVSEIEPLPGLIKVMHKFFLVTAVEIPKLAKRRKLREYGWGVSKGILRMEHGQYFHKKELANRKKTDLAVLKHDIKDYARSLGFICGFTKVDRRFIANGDDRKFPFDTAVVFGMEMDKNLLEEAPYPGRRLFDFEIYVKAGYLVFDVAKFILKQGYRCYVRIPFDGCVKYPPHAINAGLGELGAQGVVITKEFGPRVRWCMISVDADIEPDEPVDLHMASYCDQCKLCIKSCPGKAISEERIWWRGVYKRKNNDTKCYPFFVKYEGCGICLKVCPINKFGYDACMLAYKKEGIILGKV